MLTNEIPYNFRVLWNQPIDSRYVIESIDNLGTDIPKAVRYVGLKVWIKNINRFFIFKTGIEDNNFVPFNQTDIVVIDSVSDLGTIPVVARFTGMMVFVKDTEELYCFKKGTANTDLVLLNNDIIIIKEKLDITTIPTHKRFHGRLFYVTDTNELYSFIEPCGNADIILVNSSGKDYYIVNQLSDTNFIPNEQKTIGTLIYDLATKMLYIYKTGIQYENLHVFQNLNEVDEITDLTAIPNKFHNQFVWVNKHKRFFQYNQPTDKWSNNINDSVTTKTLAEYNTIVNDAVFKPQFIIRSDEDIVYYYNGTKYLPITLNTIPVYDTVDDVLNLSNDLKIVGKLYFIKDKKQHYTFNKTISNSDFISITATKIISSLSNIDADFPIEERIIGNRFLDSSTNYLYYLTSTSTWNKFSVITEIVLNNSNIEAGKPFIINHNLQSPSIFLDIVNSMDERVHIDFIYGKPTYANGEDVQVVKQNYITLLSDVTDIYSISLKTY